MPIPRLTPDEYEFFRKTGIIAPRYVNVRKQYNRNQQILTSKGLQHLSGKKRKAAIKRNRPPVFWGIDGEGKTDDNGVHRYTLLACVSEFGERDWIENPKGLSTHDCLRFMVKYRGPAVKYFAFAFGYDLTKILEDLDDVGLYKLFRPELRQPKKKRAEGFTVLDKVFYPRKDPVVALDWLNGKFDIKPVRFENNEYSLEDGITVFDIWKFYQGKFTDALEKWKVPDNVSSEERAAILKRMRDMKDMRALFNQLSDDEIREYCFGECQYMARLARLLVQAHEKAGIPLKSFFGAGSSAGAMLDVMGYKPVAKACQEVAKEYPLELQHAIKVAFTGGRFENSIVGIVEGPLDGWDISSAYPYQSCFLPCLIHGKWAHTKNRKDLESCVTAVVRYQLHKPNKRKLWGPFPFRFGPGKESGSICYPEYGSSGWVWRDEYLAGEAGFSNVEFLEAWVYNSECGCKPPLSEISNYYRQRLLLGKEGAGIVLKLGANSVYGKLAQSIGGALGQFTNWVYAGMTTSGCRAQFLQAMNIHSDIDNILMVATDGFITREKLSMPVPKDTGTFDCLDEYGKPANKPLGGWEGKTREKPMFFMRPGIYFPLQPSDKEIETVRARGIGRKSLYDNWALIVKAWKAKAERVEVGTLGRFIGAKTGILQHNGVCKRKPEYGQWVDWPIDASFNPKPKRESVTDDNRLELRVVDGESAPYRKAIFDDETAAMKLQYAILCEQPDIDWSVLGEGEGLSELW